MLFTKEIADEMWRNRVLLRSNSAQANLTHYGWQKLEEELDFKAPVRLEANSGLFGGQYHPCIGGLPYTGYCTIGSFSYSYSALPEPMVVGRYCSISSGLVILDSHHPTELVTTSIVTFRPYNDLVREFVPSGSAQRYKWDVYGGRKFPVVGNDVWIGRNVTLSMGITIGTGAIVAASSVVTKDVPPYAVVAGNPAQIVKFRMKDEIARQLMHLEWWNYDLHVLQTIGFDGPERFCAELSQRAENGELQPYVPKCFTFD